MDFKYNRESLKPYIKDYTEMVTTKSKNNMYVCPICHSGEGKNHTGAFSLKDDKFHCFACGAGGDIFDLVGAVENISDHKEQYNRVVELYQNHSKSEQYTHTHIHIHTKEQPEEKQQVDYTDYLLKAHKEVSKTTYWSERGISQQTVDKFKLGYDSGTDRVTIPITKNSYKARATKPDVQPKYRVPSGAGLELFNSKALATDDKQPLFIVEGEIDALSIIEAGGDAIALGSTNNIRKFLNAIKEKDSNRCFIICMDNDTAGEKASAELIEELGKLEKKCFQYNICAGCKDANELLVKDREKLKESIATAVSVAQKLATAEEDIARENYLKTATSYYLQSFVDGIAESVNTPYVPTGFEKLDKVLDGGLYEGLYVVGAISSLGKTTIVLQIADQIAKAGTDVLIFSLEMARNELISKSISRNTIQRVLETKGDARHAKTNRGITAGHKYKNYCKEEHELIQYSINKYGEYAKNIYIKEGIGDIGVNEIRKAVEEHIFFTGKTPVVVIDYIQILSPYNEKLTDKQNMDRSVLELKRISRDYKTTVLGVSSLNRASYKEAISMEAFKESGAIEYSSDVLIGLQLKGAGKKEFNVNEAKAKSPREIELVILKNRNGKTGDTLDYNFYTMFNYFTEEN